MAPLAVPPPVPAVLPPELAVLPPALAVLPPALEVVAPEVAKLPVLDPVLNVAELVLPLPPKPPPVSSLTVLPQPPMGFGPA